MLSLPARSDRRDAMALAASLSGLRFTFSAGVDGAAVEDRVLPADSAGKRILPGNKGSWRGHMNILRRWAPWLEWNRKAEPSITN